jgi:hypothetical protein
MSPLITNEEMAALLGTKLALAWDNEPNSGNCERHFRNDPMQYGNDSELSLPVTSIRDIISSDEIAALLFRFPVPDEESIFSIAKNDKGAEMHCR